MSRPLIAGLSLLVAVLALPAAPKPKDREPSYYFPSTVGDKLVFESVTMGETIESTWEVVEVEKQDGMVAVTIAFGARRATFQCGLSASGIKVLRVGETVYSPAKPRLRIPAKPGETWTWKSEATGEKDSYKTVGEEEIEVPAGKFKTVRVEVVAEEGTYTDWYAVGLGSIKLEWNRPESGQKGVRVLKSFTPGKK